jgi:hypothetical protein
MTDVENYSNLVNEIFGVGVINFGKMEQASNNVIGALNHANDYIEFKTNFKKRLERLKAIYSNEKNLLETVKQLADDKNWEGAFAELVAYDKLNLSDLLLQKAKLNVTIDKDNTFKEELGGRKANFDCYFEDLDIYMDVKSFKDNVQEILHKIYEEIGKFYGFKNLMISEEYDLSISFNTFQGKRNELCEELKKEIWEIIENTVNKFSKKYVLLISYGNFKQQINNLDTNQKDELCAEIHKLKIKAIKSKVVNLSYKIIWSSGILCTERTYDPYRHAQNFHKQIFGYADKFHKSKPSIIVLVIFPWYNQLVHIKKDDGKNFMDNRILYRSVARKVYCQYKYSETLFKNFETRFTGEQTIYEVSQNLSGIIFLEDNSILSKTPEKTNVEAYVYLNPNAKNPIKNLQYDYLLGIADGDFDNFQYDNY